MIADILQAASQTGVPSTCDQRRTWEHEWRDVIFSNESSFCLQHHDGRIRVMCLRGERTLAACIRHCHTGPSLA